jgi:alpha-tubulin suppressor-like RCC1 family protein
MSSRALAMLAGLCIALLILAGASATAQGATNTGVMDWGENGSGQLGDGTTGGGTNAPVAVDLPPGVRVTAVAGGDPTLALLSSGKVLAWGGNEAGELGDGTTTSSDVPVYVTGLDEEVTAIAGNGGSSLALLKNGTVMAWGEGSQGDLGDGSRSNSDVPVPVHLSLMPNETVTAISQFAFYDLALLSSGKVMAWGVGEVGRLGDGTEGPETCGEFLCSTTPVEVTGLPEEAIAISAGYEDNLAVLRNGSVMAWGYGGYGGLGDGGLGDSAVPVAVCAPGETAPCASDLREVTAVAAGGSHNLALLRNGTVVAWGNNYNSQLGDGTDTGPETCGTHRGSATPIPCSTTPVAVSGLSGVKAISAGYVYSLALLGNGTVMGWGQDYLGNGSYGDFDIPVVDGGLSGVTAISGGAFDGVAAFENESPAPETGSASSVTQGSATVSATVNPNGATVSECKFEYGTTTAYGSSVPCSSSPGLGTKPVAVSASLTGLAANTTYHFRISATNADGTSEASDATFATLPDPPAVATEGASAVTLTSAILNATVNPRGATVSECKFEYGTTAAYGSSVPCSALPGYSESAVSVLESLTGLAANTTYHFRISATNIAGTSKGSDETLTTLPDAPTVATGAPSSIAQTSATLQATVSPHGARAACQFEYGSTTAYGSSVPCSPSPGSGESPVAVSASVTGLTANVTYHFRIVATNAGGTTDGDDATFSTSPNAPTAVTDAASETTQASATLNATVNPEGADITECQFEYGSTTAYGSSVPCSPSPGSGEGPVAVSASITGLTAKATYHFRVSATSTGGSSLGSDEALLTLPNAPAIVPAAVSEITETSATLNATVNPEGAVITECQFEYGSTTAYGSSVPCSPSSTGSGESPVSVSAALSGLAANTTYHYRISSTNSTGTSYSSDQAITTLLSIAVGTSTSPEGSASAAVGPLQATAGGGIGTVTVGQYGSDPVGSPAFESDGEYLDAYLAPASTFKSLEFSDCELNGGTGLYWWNSPAGEWEQVSNAVYAPGPPACVTVTVTSTSSPDLAQLTGTVFGVAVLPPTVATGGASSIARTTAALGATVNPNGRNITSCVLEYGASLPSGATAPCGPSPGSGTSAVSVSALATGLTPDTTYRYRVIATNAGGTSTGEAESFTTVPNAPVVVTGTATAITRTTATLKATVNPSGGAVTSCVLEYGSALPSGATAPCSPSPGSGTSAVSVSALATGLTPNTTYQYRVVARNVGGSNAGEPESFTTALYEAPEFGRCAKGPSEKVKTKTVYHGGFTAATCLVRSGTNTGQYEWHPGVVKAGFTTTIKPTTKATLETAKRGKVTCTGESSAGAITSLRTVGNVVVKFTGCASGTKKCTTAGLGEGELETQRLEGIMGSERITVKEGKETRYVALDLYPVGETAAFLEYTCTGSAPTTLAGSILATVTADKMLGTATLVFTATAGKQKPEAFLGGERDVLTNTLNEQVGLTVSSTQTSEEPVEINAWF